MKDAHIVMAYQGQFGKKEYESSVISSMSRALGLELEGIALFRAGRPHEAAITLSDAADAWLAAVKVVELVRTHVPAKEVC